MTGIRLRGHSGLRGQVLLKELPCSEDVGLIFFGLACLLRGWLIARSTFLPRALGALLAAAGACYLVNSCALLLAPPLADLLFPWVLLPSFVGELALSLWLLVKGMDEAAWRARLAEAG
ncbi:MAG TPA: DUF4386 domain-containing protein [Burkholderiaceae bacterium]|nr:DUF4386 domain-containing protein [Burkholderiaceae bacterium]